MKHNVTFAKTTVSANVNAALNVIIYQIFLWVYARHHLIFSAWYTKPFPRTFFKHLKYKTFRTWVFHDSSSLLSLKLCDTLLLTLILLSCHYGIILIIGKTLFVAPLQIQICYMNQKRIWKIILVSEHFTIVRYSFI